MSGYNHTGEKHDRGGGDNSLIDPGPVNDADPKAEKAARDALKRSTPPPIKRK